MSPATKVTDLILTESYTFSFEVTPNVQLEVIDNLPIEPAFFAVTWHAKSQDRSLDIGPLKIASYLRKKGKRVLMHLSCDLLTIQYLDDLLKFLQNEGICNLFVVLGEGYNPETSDFKSSKQLIEYIRNGTGTYFCIGVAGFTDHSEDKLLNLKMKVDSGADFIITQAFFEFAHYNNFVNKCRHIGIEKPIIPGMFTYENYKELVDFTNMCKVKVSNDLLMKLKYNEGSVCEDVVKNLLVEMFNSKLSSNHVHFFTLNRLERVVNLVKSLKF